MLDSMPAVPLYVHCIYIPDGVIIYLFLQEKLFLTAPNVLSVIETLPDPWVCFALSNFKG